MLKFCLFRLLVLAGSAGDEDRGLCCTCIIICSVCLNVKFLLLERIFSLDSFICKTATSFSLDFIIFT